MQAKPRRVRVAVAGAWALTLGCLRHTTTVAALPIKLSCEGANVPDADPQQRAGIITGALNWFVIALMVVAIIYSVAMVVRNWSHIGV